MNPCLHPLTLILKVDFGFWSWGSIFALLMLISFFTDEFEDWVDENKEPFMEKLTMLNYFDVWVSWLSNHDLVARNQPSYQLNNPPFTARRRRRRRFDRGVCRRGNRRGRGNVWIAEGIGRKQWGTRRKSQGWFLYFSKKFQIILIDPDEHPLMLDLWEDMFGIDIEHGPQIGLVDISDVCFIFRKF